MGKLIKLIDMESCEYTTVVEVDENLSTDDIKSVISNTVSTVDSWSNTDIIEALGGQEIQVENFYY